MPLQLTSSGWICGQNVAQSELREEEDRGSDGETEGVLPHSVAAIHPCHQNEVHSLRQREGGLPSDQ
jgi:hypothetical protein